MKVATQDEKKVLLNFKKITETNLFLKEVKNVREKLNLPKDGFKYVKGESDIKYPEKDESIYELHEDLHLKIKSDYLQVIKTVTSLFPVMNSYLSLLIRNYIYYNEFLYDELEQFKGETIGACRLMHANEESEYFLLPDDEDVNFSVESHNNMAGNLIHSYPISIRIRADAGQNTLVDFIKKNWEDITSLQKTYQMDEGVSIFKHSKTSRDNFIKERNDFIYSHKDLPRKEIMRLVTDKFGGKNTVDTGLINKIISLKKKQSDI